jgi:hypothetical protein
MSLDHGLIKRARAAAEKQAFLGSMLTGGAVGLGLAPRRNKLRAAMRGAGVGLTTDVGASLGGLGGAALGGLGGATLGGLGGAALGGLGRLTGTMPGADVRDLAASGIVLGGGLGAGAGMGAGALGGGIRGFQFGKKHLWDQPWPDDREAPHGPAGGEEEKEASFAAGLGALAARERIRHALQS